MTKKKTGDNPIQYESTISSSLNFEPSTFNRFSYIYANGLLLGRITSDNKFYQYFHDGLGSIISIYNSDTVSINSYSYDAFGNVMDAAWSMENHYLYTGQEVDSEIQDPFSNPLYNFRNRYYDAKIGRWTQEDPILELYELPQYNNKFVYVVNNPVNFTDILGLDVCVPLFSISCWQVKNELPTGEVSNWKLYLYELESGNVGAIGPPWYTLKCYWVKYMKYLQLLQRMKKDILACVEGGCEEEIYYKTEIRLLPIYKTRYIERIIKDLWTQKLTIFSGGDLECISSKMLNPNLW